MLGACQIFLIHPMTFFFSTLFLKSYFECSFVLMVSVLIQLAKLIFAYEESSVDIIQSCPSIHVARNERLLVVFAAGWDTTGTESNW